MQTVELRDSDLARRFLLQAFWLQKVLPPSPDRVRPILEWTLEVAGSGQPLPPVGLIADLGHRALRLDEGVKTTVKSDAVYGLSPALARMYEDYVIGKLFSDATFERAGDALRRYAPGREQARGLAFLINQFHERAHLGGVLLSPNLIKTLLREGAETLLEEGRWQLQNDGPLPLLVEQYTALSAAARWLATLLGPEDVFELEHRTALDDLGQRVALRQILQAAKRLEDALPLYRPKPRSGRQEVPTRVLDEDTYPVGGFSSLSTRGSVESLLHSQLAFMETDERPDLFDIKFLRDELLYYARDDNQFLRRRRTFVLALCADLVKARFKALHAPYQGIVLVLALIVVAVRKLTDWLSTDALTFEMVFVTAAEAEPLRDERKLLETLLRERITNGTVRLGSAAALEEVATLCAERARRSLCYCLTMTSSSAPLQAPDTHVAELQLSGVSPGLIGPAGEPLPVETLDGLEDWHAVLWTLLEEWL